MQKKWSYLTKNKAIPHQDHASAVASAKLVKLERFYMWFRTTFFLTRNSHIRKFESNEEVTATTKAYFEDIQKTYFSNYLKNLEHHWEKCSELKRDYVEK